MKLPDGWPAGALPRRLTRDWAAAYCGVSPSTLDRMVKNGTLPPPDPNKRFDRHAIDRALDKLSGIAQESDNANDQIDQWAIKRRPQKHGNHQATGG